jgi:hypothetical protein
MPHLLVHAGGLDLDGAGAALQEERLQEEPQIGDSSGEFFSVCSNEYTDAVATLSVDPWDISSWMILLEEVEQGRGGAATFVESLSKFLERFPRAWRFWLKLISHYLRLLDNAVKDRPAHSQSQSYSEFVQGHPLSATLVSTFDQCLQKCRSVALWRVYIAFIRRISIETISFPPSGPLSGALQQMYVDERKKCEQAYEQAFLNVSMAVDAADLWRYGNPDPVHPIYPSIHPFIAGNMLTSSPTTGTLLTAAMQLLVVAEEVPMHWRPARRSLPCGRLTTGLSLSPWIWYR